MNLNYYIFDFDGTLVDSMPVWAGSHIQALQRGGIPVPGDFVETITPLGNYNASKYTISLGLDITLEDYLTDLTRVLVEAYGTRVDLKPHVAEALARLRANNIRLAVLTASPHLYVDDCLKRHGIYDCFDHVWTVDDFGLTKGEPAIYQMAADRLGVPVDNCTMIDDNAIAIATAKEAGMHTIAVYDDSSRSAESALRETADRYIYDFESL